MPDTKREDWYRACGEAAELIAREVPECYRSRTFPGIIGDIKALSAKKAGALIGRKKGLGKQYASLYLSQGIDGGRGYQACALEALDAVSGIERTEIIRGRVLDAGCAVGVTAGVLGLEGVTGFDLFPDLLHAAKLTDTLAGRRNSYAAADMTRAWPFSRTFDTVMCGLVCHHLKEQRDIVTFFSSAARTLVPGGSLVITLPSGTVATVRQLYRIAGAVEPFGFRFEERTSGMVMSTDDPQSLFWMFLLSFTRTGECSPRVFIHPAFGFPEFRTPVSRAEKGGRVKTSGTHPRAVRHTAFRILGHGELSTLAGDSPLTYPAVAGIASGENKKGNAP